MNHGSGVGVREAVGNSRHKVSMMAELKELHKN